MITLVKKQHRKIILSAPIVFLAASGAATTSGNVIFPAVTDIAPEVGKPTTIAVRYNSNVPINATDGSIHFDPEIIHVNGIDKSQSDLNLWSSEPEWSENDGTASWSGGIVDGPKKGPMKGEIMRTNVTPLEARVTVVSINDSSSLLGADGSGVALNATTTKITLAPRPEHSASPDINNDGVIDVLDVAALISEITGATTKKSDLNGDGNIDINDLAHLIDLYQEINK